MNLIYAELAERVRGEVPDLDRAQQRALTAWSGARRMSDADVYLGCAALNPHGARDEVIFSRIG